MGPLVPLVVSGGRDEDQEATSVPNSAPRPTTGPTGHPPSTLDRERMQIEREIEARDRMRREEEERSQRERELEEQRREIEKRREEEATRIAEEGRKLREKMEEVKKAREEMLRYPSQLVLIVSLTCSVGWKKNVK
jgi:hypothetical protein